MMQYHLLAIQAGVISNDGKIENLRKEIMANIQELAEALSKNTTATTQLLDAVVANDARQEEIIQQLQAQIPDSEQYKAQFDELISLISDNTEKLNAAKDVQQQTDITTTSPDVEEDNTSNGVPTTIDEVVVQESEAGTEGSVSIDTTPPSTAPANNVSLQ